MDVFNFTVEGNHNYFVLEKDYDYGQTCVLVHNANCVHVTSSIKNNPRLVKESQIAGRSHQRDLDHLVSELQKGSMNSGTGTKHLLEESLRLGLMAAQGFISEM
ncbi:MAG: hypothetical protein ACRC2T_05205 [Thermoguttaceae bacterium]